MNRMRQQKLGIELQGNRQMFTRFLRIGGICLVADTVEVRVDFLLPVVYIVPQFEGRKTFFKNTLRRSDIPISAGVYRAGGNKRGQCGQH